MVPRELHETSLPIAVDAAVPDVGHVSAPPSNPKNHHGSPHASESRVSFGGVANTPVRQPNRVHDETPLPLGASERPDRVRALQPVGNGVDGDLARHLSPRMSTH